MGPRNAGQDRVSGERGSRSLDRREHAAYPFDAEGVDETPAS